MITRIVAAPRGHMSRTLESAGQFLAEAGVHPVSERQAPGHDTLGERAERVELVGVITPYRRITIRLVEFDGDQRPTRDLDSRLQHDVFPRMPQ